MNTRDRSRTRRAKRTGTGRGARCGLMLVTTIALAGTWTGCARVRPYEREYLTDPIMAMEAPADAETRELKWLEAREGSSGGTGGAGGGCACN
ncbi:MAG: DUF4266 domain-containing protein [Candidatus Eisenbacteria bacterium]